MPMAMLDFKVTSPPMNISTKAVALLRVEAHDYAPVSTLR